MTTRREPLQTRSRLLVDSVLDAVTVLLRSASAEEITTAQIAAEAGCSAAAMFRFFADKVSIFAAVAERLQQPLRSQCLEVVHDINRPKSLETTIRALVELSATHLRNEPAMRSLRWGRGAPLDDVVRAYRLTNRAIAQALVERFPSLKRDPHRVYLAVEAAGHLVGLAFETDPSGHTPTLQIAAEQACLLLTHTKPTTTP
jgi:AcrR family transcriptional regulator